MSSRPRNASWPPPLVDPPTRYTSRLPSGEIARSQSSKMAGIRWPGGSTIANRDVGPDVDGDGRVINRVTVAVTSAATAAAAIAHAAARRTGKGEATAAPPAGDATASSISRRAAAAESSRRFRSFSRQRRRSLTIGGGVFAGSRDQSGS